MSTLDDVISTVRDARAEGPDALAAMALSFGATMVLGVLRNRALRGQIAEMRATVDALEATVTTLRAERDAARDTAAQAAEVSAQATRDWDAAFDALCTARSERDAALAEAKAARESAADTAEVWRLRESVAALRADRARAVAERDRAVQEREAFSLRLSAAEHARDENRNAWAEACRERDALRDRPTYEARTVAPTEEERRAHIDADGAWLVVDGDTGFLLIGAITQGAGTGSTWIPLGADGLPCAWPVPAGEVSP